MFETDADEIAKENSKIAKENANARREWERDALRFDDFRYGTHFSKAEEKDLLSFRQAPLPISVTTAICDTAEAIMISSKPVVKVAPIINPYDDSKAQMSKQVASIYSYLIEKSWYDSLGSLQYDRVVRDYTNVGHGLFYIVPRNEFGEFNVDIKHINWRYFYPDPSTKDPFYRDMDNCVIAMRVSPKSGYRFVKTLEPDLTYEKFEEDFVKGSPEPLIDLSTRYGKKVSKDSDIMFMTRMQLEEQKLYIIIPLTVQFDSTQHGYRVVTELTPELKQMAKNGLISIREERRFALTEYTSVGSKGYKKVYPISDYNIVPLVYDHRDNPYPYGRIWYLYPLQRAYNKFIMLTVLNGSLTNSLRILAEDKSIVDENDFRKNFATAGSLLKYRIPVPGSSRPPEIIQPVPLGESFLQFPRYLMYMMEYISGIFGVMMGDSREAPEIFSTVASLQSAGGMKTKRRLAQADATLSIVGKITAEFYKNYAPPNGFSTKMNDMGEMEEPVLYNKLMAQGTEVVTDPSTDLSLGFKEVRFTTAASNGYEAGTEAALLTNLATQLKVPDLVPLILKRLNIADVDKIIQAMDRNSQLEQNSAQLQQALQEMEKKNNILANQVQQKSFDTSKAQFDMKLNKIVEKAKNDPEFLTKLITSVDLQEGM